MCLWIRNHRLRYVRISAFLALGVDLGCYVVIGVSGTDRIVGVVGRSIEGGIDLRVGATLGDAAEYVVAHGRVVSRLPGKRDAMGTLSYAITGQLFDGWRIGCVTDETRFACGRARSVGRELNGDWDTLSGGDGYRQIQSYYGKLRTRRLVGRDGHGTVRGREGRLQGGTRSDVHFAEA